MKGPSTVTFAAAALAVGAAAVGWVRFIVVPAWNTSDTPVVGTPHAHGGTAPSSAALARRVVVIVVDGLGYRDAAAAPELEPLRRTGAFRRVDATFPTFTSPAIATMVLGLDPRDSGIRLNGEGDGAPGLDSLLASAWASGVFVRVRSRGYTPFERLVRPPDEADIVGGRWAFVADRALARALPAPSSDGTRAIETWWVHLGEVDDAGHLCGSACGPYAEATRQACDTVVATAAVLDPDKDVLLAMSDHGMRPEGGHGGDEPDLGHAFLLAWGARVREGAELEPRPMRDVAPTLAVAMGVAPPSSNLGTPMLDLWDLSEQEAAAAMHGPFDRATAFACALRADARCADVDQVRAALARGEGAHEARALLSALASERAAAADRDDAHARVVRGSVAAALAALVLAVTRLQSRAAWPSTKGGLLSPLPATAGYAAVLFAHGYRPTLSSMAAEEIFVPHALEAAAVGAVALAVVGRFARWSGGEAVFAVLVVTLAFAVVAAIVGANPHEVLSPLFGCLVVQMAPLVGSTVLGAIGVAVLERHRTAATPET